MARVYDQFLRQRLTRRRLLAAAGGSAAGAAGIALLGCSDGGGSKSGTGSYTPDPNETPTLGGTLRLRQTNVFPSLSPFGATALGSTLIFGFTAYDHLWYVPIDTGATEPMLAEAVEVVDPDALQVNVPLKEAFYHDKPPVNGRMVEAQDIIDSWHAFRDDPFGLGRVWLQEIMDRLEAPDARTLIIRQKRPWSYMFGTAGAGSPASSSVLPRETIFPEPVREALNDEVWGSGRFVLEGHEGGQNLRFRAFDNWRIEGEPWLGGVDYVFLPEYVAAETQFRAGNIDQLGFQNKLQADAMANELGDEMTLDVELSRAYHSLMIKSVPPFDNPRVIKGINRAINRLELIQAVELDPEGGEVTGVVPPAQKLFALPEEELEDYVKFDQDEARALLEEADFPFDREFTLLFSSPNEELADRAQVLRDQLGQVGIKLRLEPQDLLTVWVPRVLLQADYDMTVFTHLPYEDPYLPLAFFTNYSPIGPVDRPEGRNSMLYFDQEISDAVDESALEMDLDARIERVNEAQRLIMEKSAPMLNLYSSYSFTGRRHWYRGWITGRGSYGLFNGRAWIDSSLRGS
jgi:peptide/nickel transport system substrate-binding protein